MESLDLSSDYSPIEASIHLVRYQFVLGCNPVGRVLDVACGFGYGSRWLQQHEGVETVLGVDRDKNAIKHAKRTHKANKQLAYKIVDLDKQANVEALGKFDTIVSIETLEHIADCKALLGCLKSLWTGRGPFIISLPNDPFYFGRGDSLNQYHINSGSWIDGRNWCEKIMGEGNWWFGSNASGFAVHALEKPQSNVRDYEDVLRSKLPNLHGVSVPTQNRCRLLPNNALFYMGVWDQRESKAAPPIGDTAVLYPAAGDYRAPDYLSAPVSVQLGFRPKLLLVADVPDWAFDNIAQNIKKHLVDRFTIEIAYLNEHPNDLVSAMKTFLFDYNPDFMHFFWREAIFNFINNPVRMAELCRRFSIKPAALAKKLADTVITTSVYDHLFLEADAITQRAAKCGMLDGLSVSSRRLQEIYNQILPEHDLPVIEDGVDLDLFAPKNLSRFNDFDRPLIVGWTGNSRWNNASGIDQKGLETILKPTLLSLRQDGFAVTGSFADRHVELRPRDAMPDFYAELDILICTSAIEGTPNPVLEAVACGVPVITTDVGVVREILGKEQSKFILAERSIDALKTAIGKIHDDRKFLSVLSKENLQRRHGLSWRGKMATWLNFFRCAEASQKDRRGIREPLFAHVIRGQLDLDAALSAKPTSNNRPMRLNHASSANGAADMNGFDSADQPIAKRVNNVRNQTINGDVGRIDSEISAVKELVFEHRESANATRAELKKLHQTLSETLGFRNFVKRQLRRIGIPQ